MAEVIKDKRKIAKLKRSGLLCVRCHSDQVFQQLAFCLFCSIGAPGDSPERQARYLAEFLEAQKLRPKATVVSRGGITTVSWEDLE